MKGKQRPPFTSLRYSNDSRGDICVAGLSEISYSTVTGLARSSILSILVSALGSRFLYLGHKFNHIRQHLTLKLRTSCQSSVQIFQTSTAALLVEEAPHPTDHLTFSIEPKLFIFPHGSGTWKSSFMRQLLHFCPSPLLSQQLPGTALQRGQLLHQEALLSLQTSDVLPAPYLKKGHFSFF